MKRITILLFVLLATGFVRGDLSRAQDPSAVNAKQIVVRLENQRVRVFDVMLRPAEREQTHSHPAYVVYVIEGGKIRNHMSDGAVVEAESSQATSFIAIRLRTGPRTSGKRRSD